MGLRSYGRQFIAAGCMLACLFHVKAGRAAAPQVIATLPEPIIELWPGEPGMVLAQTERNLYSIALATAAVTPLAALDDAHLLPDSTIGWRLTRLAVAVREPPRDQFGLQVIAPGPHRTLSLPYFYKIDLCAEAGLLLCHTLDAEGLTPGFLLISDLQGTPVPAWQERSTGFFLADMARRAGQWEVAIALTTAATPTCWMLTPAGAPRWKTALDPGWEIRQLKIAAEMNLVALSLHSVTTDDCQVVLLAADDGALQARLSLPRWSGQYLRLSLNGRWLAFWGENLIGLVDVTTRRVLWHQSYGKNRGYWFQYVDINDNGEIAAVFANHTAPGAIEVYRVDTTGHFTLLWESPQAADFARLPKGQSVLWSEDGRKIVLRFNRQLMLISPPVK